VQEEYQALGGYELEARAREILAGLGFQPELVDGDVGALSGGWKMRVGMAKVLLGNFDVLLMDEPTNHLDIESILWLEQYLVQTRAAVLMTCHDRDFMNRVVDRIVDIDDGELVSYTGDYDFLEQQQKDRPRARRRPYQRQRRCSPRCSASSTASAPTSRRRRRRRAGRRRSTRSAHRAAEEARRGAVRVPEAAARRRGRRDPEGVGKQYGERVVYRGFDFEIPPRRALVRDGPERRRQEHAAEMIAGALPPDSGTVKIGPSVKLGYFAQQSLEVLDADSTVLEQLDRRCRWSARARAQPARRVQFSGDEQDKRVEVLSGGEKSRSCSRRCCSTRPTSSCSTNDQPPRPRHQGDAGPDAARVRGHDVFVSHDRTFLRASPTRCSTSAPAPAAGRRSSIRAATSSGSRRPAWRRRRAPVAASARCAPAARPDNRLDVRPRPADGRPAPTPRRQGASRVGALLVLLAVVVACAVAAFCRAFATFNAWDDEGYFLLALRAYRGHGRLYEDIRTSSTAVLLPVRRWPVRAHRARRRSRRARWLLLAGWAAGALAAAWLTWRLARSLLAAAAALALGFPFLALFSAEPLHATSVVLLLLAPLLVLCHRLLDGNAGRRRPRSRHAAPCARASRWSS